MDALKLEHSLTELKIVKHLTLTPPPPRQKKWINNDNRLQRVVGSYFDIFKSYWKFDLNFV